MKTLEVICQWYTLEKATSLKRPSQKYHRANSKLKAGTAPPEIALIIYSLIHPPKMKYLLFFIVFIGGTIFSDIFLKKIFRNSTPSQIEIFFQSIFLGIIFKIMELYNLLDWKQKNRNQIYIHVTHN